MTSVATSDFAEFYAAHFHEVARQLYVYLDDRAEAQDITQEAFSRAFSRWSTISGYEHPLAWVRQVAWHLATSRLRHLRVVWRHRAIQRPGQVDGPDPDRIALVEALKALPPKHRLAVVLHHMGQLSAAEIAEQEGVAEGTVRSWLSRGRAQLAAQLSDGEWHTTQKMAFQPTGTAAVEREVKARKRLRRSGVAAGIAVVLAAAATAILLAHNRGEPPIIGPTAPPQSPSAPPAVRPIRMGGNEFQRMPELSFVDGEHAWLLYQSCNFQDYAPPCGRNRLGVTDDGGRSWRELTVPAVEGDDILVLQAIDTDTMMLRVDHRNGGDVVGHWLTKDRGRSFTWYEDKNPPLEILLTNHGYRFVCPGQTELFTHQSADECQVRTLVRAGADQPPTQPPWQDHDTTLRIGPDGRLWVYKPDPEPGVILFAVSDDDARTWRELPGPQSFNGTLEFSPDGTDVWFFSRGERWQLEGDRWLARTSGPPECARALVAKGLWATCDILAPAVPADRVQHIEVLRDGTLVVHVPLGCYLGFGSGLQRNWIQLKL